MCEVFEALREAIAASEESRRSIGRVTGIDHALLSRFVNGAGLTMANCEILADHLGLEIVVRSKRPTVAKRSTKKNK